jgi:hypothetical protein
VDRVANPRGRRVAVVAALLIVAGIITYIQFSRLGGGTEAGLPPDAPPAGVDVFYIRAPGNPHGLVAYDWSGARRGSLTLPTWVEIARLHPAPNGSGFFLNPATPGDYAAYFDRGGRTLFESDDAGFVSQAWAHDSTHVCVLTDHGLLTRLPGQPDRSVPAPFYANYTVAACSLRTDVIVLASSTDSEVVRLSTGRTLRSLATEGSTLASADANYIAVSSNGAAPVAVYKTSDFSTPAAQLDASLQPLAFSGDDSLLLATDSAGEIRALAWRTGKIVWTYNTSGANLGLVLARPSGGDFVIYLTSRTVLVRRDGKTTGYS